MKNNRQKLAATTGILLGLIAGAPATVHSATVQRPIGDFVSAQGKHCIDDGQGGCFLFVPPLNNFIGWGNNTNDKSSKIKYCSSIDYAGLADAKAKELSGGTVSFGTTTEGTVTEQPLADGRAKISVRLHTKNALTWVLEGDTATNDCVDFGTQPLVFGHRLPEVLAGEDAALGESFLHVEFINTKPGDPLPDLMQLFFQPNPGQAFTFLSISAHADGTLHDTFGVPDGTPGSTETIQTGLFMTKFKGATEDGFPAESVSVKKTGR